LPQTSLRDFSLCRVPLQEAGSLVCRVCLALECRGRPQILTPALRARPLELEPELPDILVPLFPEQQEPRAMLECRAEQCRELLWPEPLQVESMLLENRSFLMPL
jgi:hypothetical protein